MSVILTPGKAGIRHFAPFWMVRRRGLIPRLCHASKRPRRSSPRPRRAMRRSTASIPASANSLRSAFPRGYGDAAAQSHPLALLRHGRATPPPVVRLMMALKLLSLGRGGFRRAPRGHPQIEAFLRAGIVPLVPLRVRGASGDLAPLAHFTAAMMGEGEAFLGDRRCRRRSPGEDNLAPLVLGPKEGLALINGTQFSTAHAIRGALQAERLALSALVTGALSTDAAMALDHAVRPKFTPARPTGPDRSGGNADGLLEGSEIREAHLEGDERVQDPYCLRCQPQVTGAALGLIREAMRTLVVEANAATDNPSCWWKPRRSSPAAIFTPSLWPSPPIRSRSRSARSARFRTAHRDSRGSGAEFRPAALPHAGTGAQFRLHDCGGHGSGDFRREQAARNAGFDRFHAHLRQSGGSRLDGRAWRAPAHEMNAISRASSASRCSLPRRALT